MPDVRGTLAGPQSEGEEMSRTRKIILRCAVGILFVVVVAYALSYVGITDDAARRMNIIAFIALAALAAPALLYFLIDGRGIRRPVKRRTDVAKMK
jgi:hypothetical protein